MGNNFSSFAELLNTFMGIGGGDLGNSLFGNKYMEELKAISPVLNDLAQTADYTDIIVENGVIKTDVIEYGKKTATELFEMVKSGITMHNKVYINQSFAEWLIDRDPKIFDGKELTIVEGK